MNSLRAEYDASIANRSQLLKTYTPNHPAILEQDAGIAEIERQIEAMKEQAARQAPTQDVQHAASRAVINASFTMTLGETVVVGTSRVKGDKALILLLTAVP
jgi:uncharacterized protein involved in exopolysaccharide biosynthesis